MSNKILLLPPSPRLMDERIGTASPCCSRMCTSPILWPSISTDHGPSHAIEGCFLSQRPEKKTFSASWNYCKGHLHFSLMHKHCQRHNGPRVLSLKLELCFWLNRICIHSSCRGNSSFKLNTLGPLCLWQCLYSEEKCKCPLQQFHEAEEVFFRPLR